VRNTELILKSPHWHTTNAGKRHVWSMIAPTQEQVAALPAKLTEDSLIGLPGHWTIVEELDEKVSIATDRTRSHPLCFTYQDGRWLITDDIETLRYQIPWESDREQNSVFERTGFTLGSSTLVANVSATQAAEYLSLSPDGLVTRKPLFSYHYSEHPVSTPAELEKIFSDSLDTVLTRLLENSKGRQLVIPLSGGLDSRLLAAWLKKLEAPNIKTFTYGKPDSPETSISEQVASALGIEWFNVVLNPQRVRQAWRSHSADFLRATWKGTSLPHIQDWYALSVMRKQGLVDQDAIFLPGHTIVGNTHDEELITTHADFTQIQQALLAHHTFLQGRSSKVGKTSAWRDALQEAIEYVNYPKDARSIQELIEWFNLKERQAKYINNSMCSYEYFNYSWALPMLEPEVWNALLQGSETLTIDRKWYADFTNRIYAEQSGKEVNYFHAPATQMNAHFKDVLLKIMRYIRADKVLNRYRSIQVMLDHPMAFEALTPSRKTGQLCKMLSGASTLGLWTKAFTSGNWGEDTLIPPRCIG